MCAVGDSGGTLPTGGPRARGPQRSPAPTLYVQVWAVFARTRIERGWLCWAEAGATRATGRFGILHGAYHTHTSYASNSVHHDATIVLTRIPLFFVSCCFSPIRGYQLATPFR